MFQFLNGTIITTNTPACSFIALFVSIPQWYDYYFRATCSFSIDSESFNSSMVRLLLEMPDTDIKRRAGFNSSMVRLLRKDLKSTN